ncbi:MAG: M20 family metallopeptidase [Bacteroidales bacterium]|jgi:amidohydrolase|nr:M20 family metallopeptidase [Bacteroidales bacterium]
MINKDTIKDLVNEEFDEIVSIRRHLHKYPELSKQEKETSKFICNELDKIGIKYCNDIYGYGIYGFIDGKDPQTKCVAIRADMDALPIDEQTSLDFKSVNKGVMHACGHDIHMSSLLGTIKILNKLKDSFIGRVMFIFQPSEEEYPGGAISMIKAGIFNKVKPSSIFAFHSTPEMECGTVGMKEGELMASTDEIYITIKGKGGHGATPHLDIDPIVTACHVVTALQTIVSRNAKPTMPTTFSVGKFIANGRTNIIPSEVKMECIIRTFDESWRKECHNLIHRIAENTAKAFGAEAEVFIDPGYPFVYNDIDLTRKAETYAKEFLPKDAVKQAEMRMTSEDFSYFAQIIPACYFRLGTHIKNEPIANLHTAYFNADENVLKTSIGLCSYLAIKTLEE